MIYLRHIVEKSNDAVSVLRSIVEDEQEFGNKEDYLFFLRAKFDLEKFHEIENGYTSDWVRADIGYHRERIEVSGHSFEAQYYVFAVSNGQNWELENLFPLYYEDAKKLKGSLLATNTEVKILRFVD